MKRKTSFSQIKKPFTGILTLVAAITCASSVGAQTSTITTSKVQPLDSSRINSPVSTPEFKGGD